MLRKPFLFAGIAEMDFWNVVDFQEGALIKSYFIAEQQFCTKL